MMIYFKISFLINLMNNIIFQQGAVLPHVLTFNIKGEQSGRSFSRCSGVRIRKLSHETSRYKLPNNSKYSIRRVFKTKVSFNTFILEDFLFYVTIDIQRYFYINIMTCIYFHFKSFLYEKIMNFYFKSGLVPGDLNLYIKRI